MTRLFCRRRTSQACLDALGDDETQTPPADCLACVTQAASERNGGRACGGQSERCERYGKCHGMSTTIS